MNPVTFTREGDIGVIVVDNPPVNALSRAVRSGLLAAIVQGNSDPAVAALVICCAGRTFIAGADIREFGRPSAPPALAELINAIEDSGKPTIAALHGTALGGGFEVALGCHFRVADSGAKVGLPEVKLGLLPGAGGTQRLPRLIGPARALGMIVDGNPIAASVAADWGIVDAIVAGELRASAIAFAAQVVAERRPRRKVSELTAGPDQPELFAEFSASVKRKSPGFIAPLRCIEAVQAACVLTFAAGCARERELFEELVASAQSKALRHIFFAEREAGKIAGISAETIPREVRTVGVVGAGTMGRGIAMCFANAGLAVTLLETNRENLDRGLAAIRKNYEKSAAKSSVTEEEKAKRLALIQPSLSYADLRNVDLVIEAVFEDIETKKQVFAQLDAACKPGAILATNSSYLNIDEIAAVTQRPQDVVGMHFFSPANVMKLLETVRGAKTSPTVLATAMKTGRVIGKIAVPVGVSHGFVGNRMLWVRSREHGFMLEEGALPQQIDRALCEFGFPMGPFATADLAGLDIGWRNRQALFPRLRERERANNLLDKICRLGRYGQKTGAGYYHYDQNRRPSPDPLIESLIIAHSQERGLARLPISDQEIHERSIMVMINEGAKILEEGVAARSGDIDVIWVNGYGFPRFRGGPMFYADQIGLKQVLETLLKYRERFGAEYWEPAPLLVRLAEAGQGFSSV